MFKKKKLLILVPDGTGVKNYILSSFIKLVSKNFELILVHNFNETVENEFPISKEDYTHLKVPIYNENLVHKFIREALCFARLNYNSNLKYNPTILINWRRKFTKLPKKFFYKLVEIYGFKISKNYSYISDVSNSYHLRVQKSSSVIEFKKMLKQYQPDIVFTTHQRSEFNIPLFAAAKVCNIKSVSVIYSWDNMPKARIPYYSDYFFVWSTYMKEEFKDYYPDIDESRIKITGTPQFEFYQDKNILLSREEFCENLGLNPAKQILCYSGDDRLTSPFDPEYLDDMATIFAAMNKDICPQILLRPCPADDGSRFNAVMQKHNNIILDLPDWFKNDQVEKWSAKFPRQNDISKLVNIAYHSDAVINVGSTIAHDFAMFNKPAFYLNYNPEIKNHTNLNSHKKSWDVKLIYNYQHFKSMGNLTPVYWINKMDDFNGIPKIIRQESPKVAKDQKLWRDKILGHHSLYQPSNEILKHLILISNN